MAQNVYSLNVVGYYNVTIPANTFVMIANQLDTTNNTLASVLPAANLPPGAQFFKFNNGWTAYAVDDGEDPYIWAGAPPASTVTLAPGEGGMFKSPTATTLTFVGEVKQGSLTNNLPIGVKVLTASQVPQAGTPAVLGIPGEAGDQIFKYAGGYSAYAFDDGEDPPTWLPAGLTFGVGEGFFYRKAPTSTNSKWVRNFTVAQ